MTSPTGGQVVADSGWWTYNFEVTDTDATWTVPEGALRDGETYYVSVQTDDSELTLTPNPATTITTFTVNLEEGAGGPSPTDTVGSAPSGTTAAAQGSPTPGLAAASETVNLVTGNLALTASTHSISSLAGSIGLNLNYNSLDADLYGLDAQYYADSGDHDFSSADPLIGQKTDPTVDFDWGYTPIGSVPLSDSAFLVRWTGTIYFPDGSSTTTDGDWQFGVQAGGGMRVCIDQSETCSSTNAAADSWSEGASATSPVYGSTLSGVTPGPHTITVEAWVPLGKAVPTVLWLNNVSPVPSGTTAPPPFIVPSSWLSSTPASLSSGWSLAPETFNASWTGLVDDGSQVIVNGSDGSTADFKGTGSGQSETFTPPPGDSDQLTRNADGSLTLTSQSGDVYTFTSNGLISSITTAETAASATAGNPDALEYTYSGDPLQLTAITDPVSGQQVTLDYNGNGTCPTDSASGVALDPPVDMLCAISYWDGTQSTFAYNSQGELAEMDNPGAVSRFAYDSAGRLTSIEDPLAYAAVQAGVRPDCSPTATSTPTCVTTVSYLVSASSCAAAFTPSCAQVASVTQPAPTAGAAQPGHSYCYADSPSSSTCTPATDTTTVSIAGFSPSDGYATRAVYNNEGEITSETEASAGTTSAIWNAAGEQVVEINPSGMQTSTVYNSLGEETDLYGPAPTACFSTTSPYLPLSSLSGCGVSTVPHAQYGYDQGITGPRTSFWSNNTLSGPPCQETTGLGTDTSLTHSWGVSSPQCANSSGAWSLGMTGLIDLSTAGTWTFNLSSESDLSVSVNGTPLGEATGDGAWGSTVTATVDVTSPGWEPISLAYEPIDSPTASESNGFTLSYEPPGGSMTVVPYSAIDPNYGLQTSIVNPDGHVTIRTYDDASGGIDPIDGLVTQSIQDPSTATVTADGFPADLADSSGLNLDTKTGYEAPGTGSYFRKLSSTLPAGNQTTYTYYSGTEGPQAAVCGVSASTPQLGLLEEQTDPPVNGVSRVQQFVYNAAGQQVGLRVGSTNSISSSGWQCTTYDTFGRMLTQTWPANNGAPAITTTYAYSVGGNPLTSSVATTGPSTTVTSTVDLLGRVVSYTDGEGDTTTTAYAQDGAVQSTTGPQGTINYGYGPNSGLQTTTAFGNTTLATASYNGSGQLDGVTYANGTSATVGYDDYGNTADLSYTNTASGGVVDSEQATYSPGGQITGSTLEDGALILAATNPVIDAVSDPAGGFYAFTAQGNIYNKEGAIFRGSPAASGDDVSNIVGMVMTSDNKGYWLVASDGTVYNYGDATAVATITHNNPLTGAVSDPAGGFYAYTADGNIWNEAGATFHGSPNASGLTVTNIAGMAMTSDNKGYWLVASDGTVYNYGDATAVATITHNNPLTGAVSDPAGGFYAYTADGNIWNEAGAAFYGSPNSGKLGVTNTVGMAMTTDQAGYWEVSSNGVVHAYGDAGDTLGTPTASEATYSYDGAGRLTQAVMPGTTESYGYRTTTSCPDNSAGENTDRTTLTVTGAGAGTTDYCYNDADQLASSTTDGGTPSTNYAYNADGDEISDGNVTLTWDSADRLIGTSNATGSTTTYTYDAVDRVMQQQDGTTTVDYEYAGMTTSPAAILNTSGAVLDSLVYLPGGVIASIPSANGETVWSYTNLQGDTIFTADNQGAVDEQPIQYDPWGTPLPGATSVPNTPTGTASLGAYAVDGKLTDMNTGIVTMGGRALIPAEGRFVSVDPVSGGCANSYAYTFGDPFTQEDLTGDDYCAVVSAFAASTIGDALIAGSDAEAIAAMLPALGGLGNAVAEILAAYSGTLGSLFSASAARAFANTTEVGLPPSVAKVAIIIPTLKVFGVNTYIPTGVYPVAVSYGGGRFTMPSTGAGASGKSICESMGY